ncbi:hypothetical protein BJP36_26015 [Moorena producens JHB]|uniref:Uncharacterized protein n=1 Tax=Moorena producens (strain JHB) TaxID=1454205 RepID=A0A1D9G5C7_MOOP1|nr:hypothetical protein [Moorena producens]AOY82849.2 hypothetical protein BJP36_26015 [Moorena producens JHB]
MRYRVLGFREQRITGTGNTEELIWKSEHGKQKREQGKNPVYLIRLETTRKIIKILKSDYWVYL